MPLFNSDNELSPLEHGSLSRIDNVRLFPDFIVAVTDPVMS